MCDRTVEGEDIESIRTVPGEGGSIRTIDGEDFAPGGLKGTKPTFTQLTFGSGSYTTPVGCLYIDVYLTGAGGGAAGGNSGSTRRNGGGGGGGGSAFGMFGPGTYTYDLKAGGLGGAAGANGFVSAGVSSFDGMQCTSGGLGLNASVAGISYQAASAGTATNSLLPMGLITAQAPGLFGANGGGSIYMAFIGKAVTSSPSVNGADGTLGGGGGAGGHNITGTGGDGSAGDILIIEYY